MLTTSIVLPAVAAALLLIFPRDREQLSRWFALGHDIVYDYRELLEPY